MCECYPASRGYPEYMAKGCKSYLQDGALVGPCWVLDELRLGQTPEGREKKRLAYYAQLRKVMDSGAPAVDLVHKLVGFGVPSNALVVAKRPAPFPAYEAARAWWAGDRAIVPSLVLAGPVQSGKTVASAWVVLQWAATWGWNSLPGGGRQVDPMVWLDGRKLSRVGGFAEQMADLMDNAASCSLLVVDDIGREGNRPAIEALSDVLKDRIDRNRATVMSTNLLPKELGKRYGDALEERWEKRAAVVICSKPKGGR